jgi:hypothetical protein
VAGCERLLHVPRKGYAEVVAAQTLEENAPAAWEAVRPAPPGPTVQVGARAIAARGLDADHCAAARGCG